MCIAQGHNKVTSARLDPAPQPLGLESRTLPLSSCAPLKYVWEKVNYTRFFVRKIGYINFVPKSVHRQCVCTSVRPSVTFLVIVSSKPLDLPTSNFVDA